MIEVHVKYFQAIADIQNHYDDILRQFEKPKFGHSLLESWGIKLSEKEAIMEERDVLKYLIGCRLGVVRNKSVQKPAIEVVQRCFKRYLVFLEMVFKCNAHNVNKHPYKSIQKQYKACRHYLFKFSLPAWYEKLPNEILTLQEKYKNI
ncbi:hypothetical protein BTB_502p05960 (plasmid) [Bacillus thuringiensis Bt407]|uniref:Uncharacterized protein n=2 Tax=Bacillus thuringiensis TaxID=1428 RepID=A0AAP4Q683_BACTU|nr:hypothetical protein BTB_502p05960 [Bacillus thuringiensis Bt407]ERI00921.1 hypothetical protein BTCBT_002476 [Bacillus thuringiensis T01-328]MBN6707690.1 hypothetical protein [Bacillus thuringiensis]MEC3093518.1 hypothetical protein [Bacillus cereus]PQZ77785.1 hypothetical protein CQ064_07995 [Bacillus sp. MYb78]